MKLLSSAFREGAPIPPRYTCDGEDVSPPLEWTDIPAHTRSLVLIVDDPDAPSGQFVHWLLYDIPAGQNVLAEGAGVPGPKVGGATQGRNGFGHTAYNGPCPPRATHRYHFRLYALNATIGLPSGALRKDVDHAMRDHILGSAEVMGLYARKGRA